MIEKSTGRRSVARQQTIAACVVAKHLACKAQTRCIAIQRIEVPDAHHYGRLVVVLHVLAHRGTVHMDVDPQGL